MLKIPKVNRKATDSFCILCRILKVRGNSYKLQTQWGRLKNNYPVSQLLRPDEGTGGELGAFISKEKTKNIISLNAAVGKMAGHNGATGAKVATVTTTKTAAKTTNHKCTASTLTELPAR